MTFDPKRQWKRYDPEKKKCSRCDFHEWEVIPWIAVLLAAAIVWSMWMGQGS